MQPGPFLVAILSLFRFDHSHGRGVDGMGAQYHGHTELV